MSRVGSVSLAHLREPYALEGWILEIRKRRFFCISFLRKGEVMAYVGRIHNLKDLKRTL